MIKGEVKEALEQCEVVPSKKLGQNFLCDANIARWIVECLSITKVDTVVEVGPGTGALTEFVVPLAKQVILIEFDARLAERLRSVYDSQENVTVHHYDAARFDIRKLFSLGPIKFLGNLPYSSGGAILSNFLGSPSLVVRAVVMLQKEFIDRIIAKPRTKEYGILSLRMQSQWKTTPLKIVPPSAFYPRPTIDSTVIQIEPLQDPLECYDPLYFDQLIRRGFAQRRKMIRKAMPTHLEWSEVCEVLKISEQSRAEELDLVTWIRLTNLYSTSGNRAPLNSVSENELLDVINVDDEVIGQERRGTVHLKELKHRSSHIFVFNSKAELYLQKRSLRKQQYPSRWDSSAAGHLGAGESYYEGAKRELQEELGCMPPVLELLHTFPPSMENGWESLALYRAEWNKKITPCFIEIAAGQWFSEDCIANWVNLRPQDFAPGFLQCWQWYQRTRPS